VKWVADEASVHEEITNSQSTFVIEHALCRKLFVDIWDRLSEKQRLELLAKIDVHGNASDRAAIATLSGSAAISALSISVYFSGFAFYTTMSITVSSVAGWFGLTLPIAAYTGASSMIAFLTGPIGWAIAATAAIVGVAFAGRANVTESTAAVVQIHMLKVAALEGLRSAPDDIFSVVGRAFPRKPSTA
jgi:uncharacterized protein YaaW (UPF0174 family)